MKTYINKIECVGTLNLLIMNQIFAYDWAKESYPQYDVTPVAKGIIEGIQIAMNHIACMQAIETIPVVRGEWITLDECSNAGVYCSKCNKKVYKENYANVNPKSNYCPNCGARMDGGKEAKYAR